VLECLRALFVGGVRAAGQLLVDRRALAVQAGTAASVDRRRIVGELVLVGQVLARLVVQTLAKPRTVQIMHLTFQTPSRLPPNALKR